MEKNSSSDKPICGHTTGTLEWLWDEAALLTLVVVYMRVSVGRSASTSASRMVLRAEPDFTLLSVLPGFSVVSDAGWRVYRERGGWGGDSVSFSNSVHQLGFGLFHFLTPSFTPSALETNRVEQIG